MNPRKACSRWMQGGTRTRFTVRFPPPRVHHLGLAAVLTATALHPRSASADVDRGDALVFGTRVPHYRSYPVQLRFPGSFEQFVARQLTRHLAEQLPHRIQVMFPALAACLDHQIRRHLAPVEAVPGPLGQLFEEAS